MEGELGSTPPGLQEERLPVVPFTGRPAGEARLWSDAAPLGGPAGPPRVAKMNSAAASTRRSARGQAGGPDGPVGRRGASSVGGRSPPRRPRGAAARRGSEFRGGERAPKRARPGRQAEGRGPCRPRFWTRVHKVVWKRRYVQAIVPRWGRNISGPVRARFREMFSGMWNSHGSKCGPHKGPRGRAQGAARNAFRPSGVDRTPVSHGRRRPHGGPQREAKSFEIGPRRWPEVRRPGGARVRLHDGRGWRP